MDVSQLQATSSSKQDDIYDLNDDLVKLVVYSIVSVRRDHERFMDGGTGQLVVTDRMNGDAFAAWKIAEYIQNRGCDPNDHQYLRIHYAVVRRWPREPLQHEERQIEAIQVIAHKMS